MNLKEIVEESVEVLEMAAKKNNITFATDLEDVTIIGNETQLYELVFNLCDNAVRYNKPNGMVYITLKTDDATPVLIVEDTGIGVEKSTEKEYLSVSTELTKAVRKKPEVQV